MIFALGMYARAVMAILGIIVFFSWLLKDCPRFVKFVIKLGCLSTLVSLYILYSEGA